MQIRSVILPMLHAQAHANIHLITSPPVHSHPNLITSPPVHSHPTCRTSQQGHLRPRSCSGGSCRARRSRAVAAVAVLPQRPS